METLGLHSSYAREARAFGNQGPSRRNPRPLWSVCSCSSCTKLILIPIPHARHLHRPHLNRPHLFRPHLHRPIFTTNHLYGPDIHHPQLHHLLSPSPVISTTSISSTATAIYNSRYLQHPGRYLKHSVSTTPRGGINYSFCHLQHPARRMQSTWRDLRAPAAGSTQLRTRFI